MDRVRITTLAVSAFALAVLSSGRAFSQPPPQQSQMTNEPPPIPTHPAYLDNEHAMNAPQLFRFPGLSNKSASPSCMAGAIGTKARPKVVATFPANGAVVRPGVVVVRVTFDQPMSCDASLAGQSDLPNPCPSRWREVTLSEDRRSFRAVCEVKADTRYRLTLRSFRNTHGLAAPATVSFSTSGSAPIATIQQALAEDVGGPEIAGG